MNDQIHDPHAAAYAAESSVFSLPPGAMFTYHQGLLAADRVNKARANRTYVDAVARLMWRLHKRGLVHLVQQKTGPGMYEYVAIRCRPPEKKRTRT